VYLSIDDVDGIERAFAGLAPGPDDVDLVVVSDTEEILGIGDRGVGGGAGIAAGSDPAVPSPWPSTSAPATRRCRTTRRTWSTSTRVFAGNGTTTSSTRT
jgi:hypothetical protein